MSSDVDLDAMSLQVALERHLLDNGFPADGGVQERWAVVRVGPIPVCFPNIEARRRATAVHDCNHLLAGYGHDALGEAEISAWELGGGCGRYWVAWLLDWSAVLLGLFTAPRRLLRAFARGRRTKNLYGTPLQAVLGRTVGELRGDLGLDRAYPVRLRDAALFAGVICLAPVVGLVPAAAAILTSPWWIAEGAYKQRRSVAAG